MNDNLIASPIVAISGKHLGFFDVFEVEPGIYLAIPRNKWQLPNYPAEYDAFYFAKLKSKWITEPAVYEEILKQVVLECRFK